MVRYGACRCTVWPLIGLPVGRCGRCGESPDLFGETHDECAGKFRAEYREEPRDPRP